VVAPLVVSTSGVPHADSLRFRLTRRVWTSTARAPSWGRGPRRCGVRSSGASRRIFSLVAMKAGRLRAFEALLGGGGAAVPPAPAAVPPGVGAALALPPPAAPSALVVQAVAVLAGGWAYAAVLGGGA
jgi:hypothetical protein